MMHANNSTKSNKFPCSIKSGCNKQPQDEREPRHTLLCLLVKILQESSTPSLLIEKIRTVLSESYRYYYNIPPFKLIRMIRQTIGNENNFKSFKIILTDDDHCIWLPGTEDIVMNPEYGEDVKTKVNYEADILGIVGTDAEDEWIDVEDYRDDVLVEDTNNEEVVEIKTMEADDDDDEFVIYDIDSDKDDSDFHLTDESDVEYIPSEEVASEDDEIMSAALEETTKDDEQEAQEVAEKNKSGNVF